MQRDIDMNVPANDNRCRGRETRSFDLRRVLDCPLAYDVCIGLFGVRASRKQIVDTVVRPVPGMRLLDVGCGTGAILDFLPAEIEYVGYDIDPHYIEAAQRKYGTRARFFCASVSDAAARMTGTNPFDVAVVLGVLHHLDDGEIALLMDDIDMLLKPGGALITGSDPFWSREQTWLERFIVSQDRGTHVRTIDAYRSLIGRRFTVADTQVVRGSSLLPCSGVAIRAIKQQS